MKHLVENFTTTLQDGRSLLMQMPTLDDLLLTEEGRLRILPARELAKIDEEALMLWCNRHARYGIPSLELIDWLNDQIMGHEALEVGAGMGDLGRCLGIRMTDRAAQDEDPGVREHFEALGAAVTVPPEDVERIDGNEAVMKYKPSVVIASWVTQCPRPGENHFLVPSTPGGFDEEKMWKHPYVKKYIHIGNVVTHENKRLCHYRHDELFFPFLFSRRKDRSKNVVYVWDKSRGGALKEDRTKREKAVPSQTSSGVSPKEDV